PRAPPLEVLLGRLDRPLLALGPAVRELRLAALGPRAAEVRRLPLRLLAAGVEREQLARELAQARAGATLQVLPGLAAELGECGRAAVRADIAGDLADLLVRDVEAVLAPECEQQVVAGDAGYLLRLEGLQATDAVILVDDVVAGAEVGEALEGSPEAGIGSRWPLAEDLRVGEQDESQLAPDETAPRRGDREHELGLAGQRLAGLEQPRFDSPEQVLRSQRLAPVREGDDDSLPSPHERAELVLGLGEPARGERRPLRLERERLVRGERIELRGAGEIRLGVELLERDRTHLVGLPDEIRRARKRRDQVVRGGQASWGGGPPRPPPPPPPPPGGGGGGAPGGRRGPRGGGGRR